MLRLALIPVFVWLVLGPHDDLLAIGVLVVAGASDFFDGRLARRWNQLSRLGQVLDPLADRLYVFATVLVLAARSIVPWWIVGVLFLRDVLMVLVLARLRRSGRTTLPVHLVGKAATMCLLNALPLLLLASGDGTPSHIARPIAWAFVGWGLGLYWWSALLYARQVRSVIADLADAS
jgi:cardiolipin synthase